jgi:hypothetical protein
MNSNNCSKCGGFTPEYLLERSWIDELLMILSKPENEHIAPDTIGMSDYELFCLFQYLSHCPESGNVE